ncbi:hypothetical protein H0H92_007293 [Tricholoma furcatifolium]|nr:hypothetical protein H0H92_007293 [Tricholoma furcatifolium]
MGDVPSIPDAVVDVAADTPTQNPHHYNGYYADAHDLLALAAAVVLVPTKPAETVLFLVPDPIPRTFSVMFASLGDPISNLPVPTSHSHPASAPPTPDLKSNSNNPFDAELELEFNRCRLYPVGSCFDEAESGTDCACGNHKTPSNSTSRNEKRHMVIGMKRGARCVEGIGKTSEERLRINASQEWKSRRVVPNLHTLSLSFFSPSPSSKLHPQPAFLCPRTSTSHATPFSQFPAHPSQDITPSRCTTRPGTPTTPTITLSAAECRPGGVNTIGKGLELEVEKVMWDEETQRRSGRIIVE